MNRRFEDRLARIAFGDASPEDIAKIKRRAETDPEVARAFAEFSRLKAGLRQLGETPAHQLSNERLRDAILAQGLHPKPLREHHAPRSHSWLWMPVAAALLGVALVKLHPLRAHTVTTEPRLVMGDVMTPTSATPRVPEFSSNFSLGPVTKNLVAQNDPAKAAPVDNPEMRAARYDSGSDIGTVRRSAGRRHRRSVSAPADDLPNWVPKSQWVAQDLGPVASKAPAPAASTPSTSPKSAPASPLVLIDSDPDARTGAPGATEVGTASNVVIGG